MDVHFESDVSDLTSPLAEVEGSGDSWRLTNKQFDGDLTPGTLFPLRYITADSLNAGISKPPLMNTIKLSLQQIFTFDPNTIRGVDGILILKSMNQCVAFSFIKLNFQGLLLIILERLPR